VDSRRARSTSGPRGQHFLRRPEFAEQLVAAARIVPHDLVVEIGAGTGIVTRALAARSRHVVAVEVDPRLAARLRNAFCGDERVVVVEADILAYEFPRGQFRAFGNIPFNVTTGLLRRLLNERSSMTRADLIVQWEVASKRTAQRPSNLLNVLWGPWWSFSITRRIPAHWFRPRPRVNGAMLSVARRDPPWIPITERERYEAFLRRGFFRSSRPLRRELKDLITPRQLKRVARELGFSSDARAIDLDAHQWAGLFDRVVDSRSSTLSALPRRPRSG
jgi:23S rRNA (adenine-N6)-dimethyltransferase